MVVAVVLPSLESKSATNRDIDEASLYFPEEEDLGTEVADISIVLVYNWSPLCWYLWLKKEL